LSELEHFRPQLTDENDDTVNKQIASKHRQDVDKHGYVHTMLEEQCNLDKPGNKMTAQ
jgi:hypothetical protein